MASTNITTFPGKVAIGSNVFIDDTASNKLVITGSISTTGTLSGDGSGIDNIQTSNVIGLTSNVQRIVNLESNLSANSLRITTISNDLSDNSSRITTISNDLNDNSSRITTISNDLNDNSSRIATLESSDVSITGKKTFTEQVTFESNIRVQGDLLVANTVNMVVSDPIMELGANNLNTGDLGIIMTRHGVSNSNVAVFYDETADILKMGYTLGGANDTTITLENDPLSVSIQGTLEVDTANVNTMNVSAIEGLQTLSFSSDSTTVPPLQLTAGSLNDGVGALRIDSVEPDIFLNDTDGGFSTVTFANNGESRAAFGRNSGDDFYITVRDPATNGGNWRNTSFVVDSSTGDVSMGYGLTATTVSGDGSSLTALNGDQVTTGTVAAARIDNLDGSKITTGTVAAARIDNLDASKITTGTITRGVSTSGVVAAGTLSTDGNIDYGLGSGTRISFPSDDTITFTTDAFERVRINSSGNVGIGTGSPDSKLNIYLDSETGTSNTVGLTITNASSDYTSVTNGFGSRILFRTNRGGTSATNTSKSAEIKGYVYAGAGGTEDYHALDLNVYGDNNSLNKGISIQSMSNNGGPADTIVHGNVGIGTNNPEYKLHIEDGTAPTILLENTDSALTENQDVASILFKQNDVSSAGTGIIGKIRIVSVKRPNAVNYYGEGGNMVFSVGDVANNNANVDALVIRGDGNVGIGTTDPSTPLQVHGGGTDVLGAIAAFKNSAHSNRLEIKDEQSSPYIPPGVWGLSGGGLALGTRHTGIRFYASENGATETERMFIKGNGNVGIGLTNPSYPLHVNGISRLNQYIGSRSGTFSGSGTFYLPGDLNYGFGVGTAPAIGWEIHLAYGFTGTNGGTFYISGCQDTSGSVSGANESSTFRIHPGNNYGNASSTCYLAPDREVNGNAYYAKITIVQVYNNNVASAGSRFHMMFESVGCQRAIGSTKTQGSAYFTFPTSSRRPRYLRLTCNTGSVQGNYMINALTA